MLVAPVVQTYIYECGLYVRSPEQKDVLRREALYFRSVTQDEQTLPQAVRACMRGKKRPARRFCWQDLRVCSAGRRDIRFCWTICMTRSALWTRAAMCASTPPARSCSLTRRRPRGRTRCGCSSTSCLPEVLSRGTPMRSAAVGKTRRSCRVPCASSALHRPQTASIMSICATPSCSCRTPCSASSPRTATHPLCARPFCRPGPAYAWRSAPCSLASSFCASTQKCSIRPLPNALSA